MFDTFSGLVAFARGQCGDHPWMILPFGLLLAAIALAPLFFADWWSKHYAKVAFGLAAVTLAYYFFGLQASGRC